MRIALVMACLIVPGMALADSMPISQLKSVTGVSIEGTVTHVFGNKFVLQDSTGTVLVDAGPKWSVERRFNVGEKIKVRGKMDDAEFEVREMERADGTVDKIRPDIGPPPWAGKDKKHRVKSGDRD